MGRRTRRVVNGATTDFLYDGLNPVQELAGGSVVANLLTGLGIDEYFTRTDAAGLRALLTDALGSTVALTDASGSVQTQYTYQPFGGATVTGSPSGNSFQFTGRENDETGLHYYRARYYHSTLHRFIAEDPHLLYTIQECGPWQTHGPVVRLLSRPIGFSTYAYAANNPVGLTDPLGLRPVDMGKWFCPLCVPIPPGCTPKDDVFGIPAFTDTPDGLVQKWIICRFTCGSDEQERLKPCAGPFY